MSDKDAAPLRFKSDTKAWVADGTVDFTDFAEPRGPRGGRVVIDNIIVHASLSLTVATATTQGEDLYRFVDALTIEEKDGAKRCMQMRGDAARIVSWAHNGAARTHEHADFAAGGPTVIPFTLAFPLTKPYAYEGGDYALAAELLQTVRVKFPSATGMSLGTSVATINSGSYWVIAEAHEEFGVVQHVSDEWLVRPLTAVGQTEFPLEFSKGRLTDLYVWIPGIDGGLNIANLTEVFVEHLMPRSLLTDPDLRQFYARRRNCAMNFITATGGADTTNPFTGTAALLKAAAALLTTGNKAYETPERTKANIRFILAGNLPGVASIVARIVHPRNEVVQQELMRRYKKTGFYVKGSSKTRREVSKWRPEHLAYMPIKFY